MGKFAFADSEDLRLQHYDSTFSPKSCHTIQSDMMITNLT